MSVWCPCIHTTTNICIYRCDHNNKHLEELKWVRLNSTKRIKRNKRTNVQTNILQTVCSNVFIYVFNTYVFLCCWVWNLLILYAFVRLDTDTNLPCFFSGFILCRHTYKYVCMISFYFLDFCCCFHHFNFV